MVPHRLQFFFLLDKYRAGLHTHLHTILQLLIINVHNIRHNRYTNLYKEQTVLILLINVSKLKRKFKS